MDVGPKGPVCNSTGVNHKNKGSTGGKVGAKQVNMLRVLGRDLVFRPRRDPVPGLPLSVRSCGYYLVDTDFGENREPKHFYQLFWTAEGEGTFGVDGRRVRATAESLFLYRPGERHLISPSAEGWAYRFLTLDGEMTAAILDTFGLNERIRHHAGPCPHEAFKRLRKAMTDPTPSGERIASTIAYEILVAASATVRQPGPGDRDLAGEARAIIDAEFTDAGLTVEAIADRLAIHRSTFFREFRRQHGVGPSHYLQTRRLQRALTLLRATEQPVADIAVTCGFADANYFAKVVRRFTGLSPRAFRKG